PMTFEVEKRAVGVVILLLAVVLLLTPVPLSNVAPAMVISLISVAYVEEDGLLLAAAFLAAIIVIGLGSAAVWGTIIGAALISAWVNRLSTGAAAQRLRTAFTVRTGNHHHITVGIAEPNFPMLGPRVDVRFFDNLGTQRASPVSRRRRVCVDEVGVILVPSVELEKQL